MPANPMIAPGSNVTFSATAYFADGSEKNVASVEGLSWTSSNPTVASMDTNGLATGLSPGATIILATWSNVTGDTVLTVLRPATISADPVNGTVWPGGSVTLSVSTIGSDWSYQWVYNGTNIVGATNTILVITNVSLTNAGSYAVTVSNAVGSFNSQTVSVSIELFQSVISTNWNNLVTGWTQTSATNELWYSIASSSDGAMLTAVVGGGGIWTSTNAGATWVQTIAPSNYWNSIASSSDGIQLAAVVWGAGIWTSTNAGATWAQTSAPSNYWDSIASSSDGTHLAAVAYGGIWTSSNAGATWSQTSAPNQSWYSIASSSDGTHLAAGANGGIWTSSNSGATWSQTSAPNQSWNSIASSSDGIHFAAGAYGGIWTSSNSGAAWSHTSAPYKAWDSVASSSDGTHLTAVTYGGGIWTAQAAIQTNTGLTGIVITPANPVIVVGSNTTFSALANFPGGAYVNLTAANGLVWSSSDPTVASIDTNGLVTSLSAGATTISANYSNVTGIAAYTGLTVVVPTNIVITPVNPVIAAGSNVSFTATGYFTNGFVVNLTAANGLVWSSSNPTVASIDTNGLATGLSAGTTTVSATLGNITGLTVLTVVMPPGILTNPVSTTALPGGRVTLSITASSSYLSYQWAFNGTNIVGATNATLVITNLSLDDVGSYMVTVSNPAGSVSSQAASVASMNLELFQGGTTNWNSQTSWTRTSAPGQNWFSITSSSDGTKLAAVVWGGGIWTSINAGATWVQTSAPGGQQWNAIASSSDGTKLAAVVNGGGIWTSTNAGATWVQTSAPGSQWWSDIVSSSDGTKLAALISYTAIWTSTDAGATWTQHTSALGVVYWFSVASSSDGTMLAAAAYSVGGGIYTSTNAGATWTKTSAPSSVGLDGAWLSIASSADGTKLAAVPYSGGIYTSTNAGMTWNKTSAPSENWMPIASSSDGSKLAVVANGGGIWTSTDSGMTWAQTRAPHESWLSIASSADGTKLAATVNGGGIWSGQATIFPATGKFASLELGGPLGSNYLIQAASNLTGNWTTVTNVAVPWGPYFYIDYGSPTNAQQFYRAVPAP